MFMRLLVRRLHVPRTLLSAPLILSENSCMRSLHVMTLQWKEILLWVTDNNWGIDSFRTQGYCQPRGFEHLNCQKSRGHLSLPHEAWTQSLRVRLA